MDEDRYGSSGFDVISCFVQWDMLVMTLIGATLILKYLGLCRGCNSMMMIVMVV